MIAIALILGLSVLCLIALFLLGIVALHIAGDYQKNGKDKQSKKVGKTD